MNQIYFMSMFECDMFLNCNRGYIFHCYVCMYGVSLVELKFVNDLNLSKFK
jgi:hypothetical protein